MGCHAERHVVNAATLKPSNLIPRARCADSASVIKGMRSPSAGAAAGLLGDSESTFLRPGPEWRTVMAPLPSSAPPLKMPARCSYKALGGAVLCCVWLELLCSSCTCRY